VNVILWVGQVLLALAFLGAGFDQAANYDDAGRRLRWVAALTRPVAAAIGLFEILCAAALILPGATGYQTWLTPAAALALALMMAAAAAFHARRHELPQLAFSGTFGLVAVLIAFGRLVVTPL
jgi:uncharacterized membrane protein YphA (DoxX/SURF4 family)